VTAQRARDVGGACGGGAAARSRARRTRRSRRCRASCLRLRNACHNRAIPARALLPAIGRLAHTLAFAHEHGVVHRDVKPDNVVLGKHGETVLLDWGIAKVRGEIGNRVAAVDAALEGESTPRGATVAGSLLGTPAYMAPEQASARVAEIDERTDVFAVGAVRTASTPKSPRAPGHVEVHREAAPRARRVVDRLAGFVEDLAVVPVVTCHVIATHVAAARVDDSEHLVLGRDSYGARLGISPAVPSDATRCRGVNEGPDADVRRRGVRESNRLERLDPFERA
jgi:hypothetical protein